MTTAEAGPSNPVPANPLPPKPKLTRKPKSPHPSKLTTSTTRKLPPPLPPRPTPNPNSGSLPLKTVQGLPTRRTDTTHPGFGRDVIFVTRKTGLGMLIGRARSLVMDEGYTKLTIHALGAAIPQALLLLHAILDILPYPTGKKGMWYEIRTGSVECVDEVDPARIKGNGKGKGKVTAEGDGADVHEGMEEEDLGDLGGMEASTPIRKIRIKSSIQIDLHISPRPNKPPQTMNLNDKLDLGAGMKRKNGADNGNVKPNRPSKKRRAANLRRQVAERGSGDGEAGHGVGVSVEDEEGFMNGNGAVAVGVGDVEEEEEQEEIED